MSSQLSAASSSVFESWGVLQTGKGLGTTGIAILIANLTSNTQLPSSVHSH